MSRRYYTLVCRDPDDGRWYPQLGSFDRAVVEAECRTTHDMRIVTSGSRKAVDAAIAKLNADVDVPALDGDDRVVEPPIEVAPDMNPVDVDDEPPVSVTVGGWVVGSKFDPATFVDAVKRHALAHYNEGGWDFVVECWSDADIVERIGDASSSDEAIARVERVVATMHDVRHDIQNA